jgi:LysR family transcriptional regulator, benzoate and cis,cis-muconate-responsive activator of ben and cat genes
MEYSLRELECFTAVAEELSFTLAASKLHLAQPPLSRHVRSLEEKMGTALFDRTGRRVTLTPAGALFYEETRTILPQLRRAGEATRRFASGQTRRLRLGFVSAVLGPEMTDLLRRFREQYPDVQLNVQDGLPAELLAAVGNGTLDGAFVGLRPEERTTGIVYKTWRKEPLAAFVPLGHPCAEKREIALAELAGEPLVAVSSDAAPAFAAFVRRQCAGAGFRARIVVESTRAQAVAVMVAAGSGVALLPASLARVVGKAAAIVPLKKAPALTHVFARKSGAATETVKLFLTLVGRGAER